MDNFDVIMAVIVGLLIIAAIIVFLVINKNSNTRNGYIDYCFEEAKKCEKQGNEDGKKLWMLRALKASCHSF